MKYVRQGLILGVVGLAASTAAVSTTYSATPANPVLARALAIEKGQVQPRPHEQKLSSGVMYALLSASGELNQRANALPAAAVAALSPPITPRSRTSGCQNTFVSDQSEDLVNVRVNQDCSLRRQAEEVIAINPTDSDNLIAGQNDSRIGFNHCGYAWSFDRGKHWGDMVPPFYQFLLADGHTADACSDPTATFDADGNAYVGGVLFEVNFNSSAVVIAKSNAEIGGAFYHTPNASLAFQTYRNTPLGVASNDDGTVYFNDKELIVADASTASAKKNNVYATWTLFGPTDSPIYFSQSTDGGATWSRRIEISGASAAICKAGSGELNPNACDQDQGSHPVVGRDGTLYVSFNNGNVLGAGIGQQIIVRCPSTADCSNPLSWSAPAKIADDIATQPLGPSAATACAGGRQCLPPNGYRLDDFGALSVDNGGNVYFVWSDFRNGGGACPPLGNAASITGGCDNDVFYSYSTDGGATWSPAFNVTPKARFGVTAQWQAWGAITPDGKTLFAGYYDRSYGNCEATGCNDITLARVKRPASATPSVSYQRLTTSSMPNLVPANNPLEAGFLGDYMWVATDSSGKPYVVWADTRGLGGTVEEDIYFAAP
jgi:hypothetical protein